MPINPAGHTQQLSVGYLVTRDTTSVRHEKTRNDQTREVIENADAPLQKRPPLSTAAWQARLLAYPKQFHEDIDSMLAALNKLEADQVELRRHRNLASKVRRGAAEILSVPDRGNVKQNTETAIRLGSKPGPRKLTKPAPFAVEPLQEGYQSMPVFLKVLTADNRCRQLQRLRQETVELLDVLRDALDKAEGLRGDSSIVRRNILDEITSRRTTAEHELLMADQRSEELDAAIALLQKKIASATAADLVPQQWQLALLTEQAKLDKVVVRRDIALGLQAPQLVPAMLRKLELLMTAIDGAIVGHREAAQQLNAELRICHQAEIDHALQSLPGLQHRTDKQEVRQFIQAALKHHQDRPFSVNTHCIPAPVLTDIFIGALACTIKKDTPLDEALKQKTLKLIASRSGGMLAYEQITGAVIEDKKKRVAHRVDALAQTTLERLERPQALATAGAHQGARQLVLENAASAAAAVLQGGALQHRSVLENASYSAVRNAFFTRLDDRAEIDANVLAANRWMEKMLTEWIAPADEKRSLSVLKDKRPFSDQILKLQALTSTLGYDVPARPMARLDQNLRDAVARLRDLVPEESLDLIEKHASSKKAADELGAASSSITDQSLTAAQVTRLAGLMVAAKKREYLINEVRPGHVALNSADGVAMFALIEDKLRRLCVDSSHEFTRADLQEFIDTHGNTVAGPHALVDFVDDIKEHIGSGASDGEPGKIKDQLLKEIAVVRHLTSTEEVTHIESLEDLYAYLAPKVYQFELRGKLKTMEGGTVGLSTKAFSWPLSLDPGTISVVLPVRGEVKGGATRCAVFEIGFSTTGFEIFIGSETRKMKGVGAGVGVRLGWEAGISSGAGVDKTLTFERADTEGVWLRLPRSGNDEVTRDEALAVLQTLLDTNGSPRSSKEDPRIGAWMTSADGVKMLPKVLGDLLAGHPNLSVSVVGTYHEELYRNETVPSASLLTVAGGTGDDASRIQILSAGTKSERRSKLYRQRDATGFMQMTRSNALSGGSSWGQAGLISVNGLFAINPMSSSSENFGGLLSRQRQFAESAVDAKLRYLFRDGETSAVDTRVDFEDVNFEHHLSRVNEHQRELVDLGREQLFKSQEAPPQLHIQARVAKQWLYDLLDQAGEKSQGNSRHVFSLSHCLNAAPAALLDGLAGKAELERINDRPLQALHTDTARDQILQHLAAFKPWKVTTSERTSESRQFGWTTGAVYAKVQKTEGQRGTSSYPA